MRRQLTDCFVLGISKDKYIVQLFVTMEIDDYD